MHSSHSNPGMNIVITWRSKFCACDRANRDIEEVGSMDSYKANKFSESDIKAAATHAAQKLGYRQLEVLNSRVCLRTRCVWSAADWLW